MPLTWRNPRKNYRCDTDGRSYVIEPHATGGYLITIWVTVTINDHPHLAHKLAYTHLPNVATCKTWAEQWTEDQDGPF